MYMLWAWNGVIVVKNKCTAGKWFTHDSGSLESQLPAKLSNSIVKRVFPKRRMLRCQSMANLVQSELLLHKQLIVFSDSSGLEEITDFVPRFDEIFITVLGRLWIRRREDFSIFLRGLRTQSIPRFKHLVDLFRTVEVFKHDVAITLELKEMRKIYHKSIASNGYFM